MATKQICKKMECLIQKSGIQWMLRISFVLMPAIIFFAISLVQGLDIMNLSVNFNDEIGWYNQAFAVAEYGKPLGYWGYNGTHAQVSTFGPWGASMVVYVSGFINLLKSIMPNAGISIYVWNNLLWICTANFLFLVFAKPNGGQIVRLNFAYPILFVNHCYVFVAMAETMRFSMGIILTGILVFLIRHRNHRLYKVVLYAAPLVIAAFSSAYIMFALLIPVWLYVLYKSNPCYGKKKKTYFCAAVLFFVILTGSLYYINGLFSSPYVISTTRSILAGFASGFWNGLRTLAASIMENIDGCDLQFIITARNTYGGLVSFFLLVYYLLCVYLFVVWSVNRKKYSETDMELHVICEYLLCGFLAGFIMLYDTYYWILVRGLNIAFVCCVYMLCMKESSADIRHLVLVSLLGIYPFMLVANNTFIDGRENVTSKTDYATVFREHVIVSEEADPWENTIACYGDSIREYLELPVGVALNSMMNKAPNQCARYALICMVETEAGELSIENPDELIEKLEPNHDLLYRDEKIILMVRTSE